MTEMTVSETLNRAADLIEERGWTTGVDGLLIGDGPKCADGAIAAVTGRCRQSGRTDLYGYGHLEGCPASMALADHVGYDRVWPWNDDQPEAAPVIEALRACAVIEASRERQPAQVSS